MHRSNVAGLADRLEERGPLRRQGDSSDRRAYQVVLAPAGHKLLRDILPHYCVALEQIWEAIPLARSNLLAADLRALGPAAQVVRAKYE